MTGKELLAKLAESGTGESKIAAVRKAMKADTVAEVLDQLKAHGYKPTADKAGQILAAAGVSVPNVQINADAGLRAALDEYKATNTKLRNDLREANAAAEANANKAKTLDAKVADLEKSLAEAKAGKGNDAIGLKSTK